MTNPILSDVAVGLAAVQELHDAIRPLLTGRSPAVQGAVLADLVASWLAGHQVPGDADKTGEWRAALLAEHCSAVRHLVTINAQLMGTEP